MRLDNASLYFMAKLQTGAFHRFIGIGCPFQMHFQTEVYAYNANFQQTYPVNFWTRCPLPGQFMLRERSRGVRVFTSTYDLLSIHIQMCDLRDVEWTKGWHRCAGGPGKIIGFIYINSMKYLIDSNHKYKVCFLSYKDTWISIRY